MSKYYYCPRCKKQFQKEEQHLMCSSCGFQLSTYRIEKSIHRNAVMKKLRPVFIIGVIALILGGSFLYVSQRSQIGEIGEDGGIIFFDKLFYSNGWRYLEVSPKELGPTTWSETINEKTIGELVEGLGSGAHNSYNIIYRYGAKSAAYKAIDYGNTDDWYLGSVKEMSILRFISKSKFFQKKICSLEEFSNFINTEEETNKKQLYWTSELINKDHAYTINFDNGEKIETEYTESCLIRPIRKF